MRIAAGSSRLGSQAGEHQNGTGQSGDDGDGKDNVPNHRGSPA
jgi:hypothetical protein